MCLYLFFSRLFLLSLIFHLLSFGVCEVTVITHPPCDCYLDGILRDAVDVNVTRRGLTLGFSWGEFEGADGNCE